MLISKTPVLASLLALTVSAACSSGNDSSDGSGALGNGAGGTGSIRSGAITGGPRFPGAGTSFTSYPLSPAQGPETRNDCSTTPALPPAGATLIDSSMECYYGATPDPSVPAATVEHVVEVLNGVTAVHVRVTFNPAFVDNTYGTTAIGWGGDTTTTTAPVPAPAMGAPAAPGMGMAKPGKAPPGMGGMAKPGKGGHTFKDLVGSDHVELKMVDKSGALTLQFKLDYISEDSSSACGYHTLGVAGGDGNMSVGNPSAILAVATSLDRDLNGCGYCLTEDSPGTDASYTPNTATPKWDYRVVYEVWVDPAAFGASGFGSAVVESVHASPSKLSSATVEVERKPCPPDWDVPYCPPGSSCGGTPGSGGAYGTGGAGGSSGICPVGWVPDLASEGKFCVPE